ncbi:MAG TPA: hypothetical protein VMT63_08555 [Bacteroidales bacterium]|nr:hypothetical protein [Bacteroidales bacterium]
MKENEETRLARFRRHCYDGTEARAEYLALPGGVNLNVVSFKPVSSSHYPPVLFIPGLASVIESFAGVISALTKDFIVYYLETREKESSRLPGGAAFGVREMAGDIAFAAEALGLKEKNYIIVSYSYSATLSVEMFSTDLKVYPSLMVLVQPVTEFRVPWFGIPLAKYLYPLYPVVKPFLKLYFRRSLIDTEKDMEMYNISVRSLDSAHPRKMAKTILAMSGYRMGEAAKKINVPVMVISTSQDTFHRHDDTLKIVSLISRARHTDLVTNTRSHSGEVCDLVKEYFT